VTNDIERIDNTDLDAIISYSVDPIFGVQFAKTLPNCHTCNSPHRTVIETQYVLGHPVPRIIELLEIREGHGIDITPHAMHEHFRRQHCTTDQALRMVPQWNKAYELGVDPQTYEDALSTSVLVTQITVDKFRRKLIDNAFNPDFKDGLAAVKLLYEMEKIQGAQSTYEPQDMFIAISIFMAHVQAVFARFAPQQKKEAMEYFTRLLEADPILKDIIEKTRENPIDDNDWNEGDIDPAVLDAVIVEPFDTVPNIEYNEETVEGTDWDEIDPWSTPDIPT
jgi:hypothetical protein